MRKRRQITALLAASVLAAALLGTAVPELIRMGTGSYAGFLSAYSLKQYMRYKGHPVGVFLYVCTVRLRKLMLLWLGGFTPWGIPMHLLAIWHLALTGGMLIALLVLRTGTRGVLLFLCCLLPQWLLYAAMWSREVQAMLRRGRRQKDSSNTENQIREIWLELSELAGMCLLCIAGAAVESFLARWILQLWMRLF